MTEERVVVVNEPDAQVVQYSTSEDSRREQVASASERDSAKFHFTQGQAQFLARRKAEYFSSPST